MSASEEMWIEREPPPSLRPFIRRFWAYAAPQATDAVQRIAPDGCPELVLDVGAPYEEQEEVGGPWRVQAPVIFAGQMTRPMGLRATGPIEIVSARFEPDGARGFLGHSLRTATDRRLDLRARLPALSLPPGDPDGQIAVLCDWLEGERRRGGWRTDDAVRAEVEAARDERPAAAADSAARRALQRRFLDHVGVSPRLLRSVFRFRRVFDHAEGPDAPGWLEAGLEAGYFDQPQLARDFRRFLGCTATEWAREQHELARWAARRPS